MLSCRILILLKHFTSKLPAKIQYLPIIINVLPKISFKIIELASVFIFCVYELTEFIELASAVLSCLRINRIDRIGIRARAVVG